jgi:hypothetical protein
MKLLDLFKNKQKQSDKTLYKMLRHIYKRSPDGFVLLSNKLLLTVANDVFNVLVMSEQSDYKRYYDKFEYQTGKIDFSNTVIVWVGLKSEQAWLHEGEFQEDVYLIVEKIYSDTVAFELLEQKKEEIRKNNILNSY